MPEPHVYQLFLGTEYETTAEVLDDGSRRTTMTIAENNERQVRIRAACAEQDREPVEFTLRLDMAAARELYEF